MTTAAPAPSPALSATDLEHFLTYGFVHLTDCFDTSPGSVAHRWVQESWSRTGLSPDDRSTWPNDKVTLPDSEWIPVRDFSPRAFAAICALSGGEDRAVTDIAWGNRFIANYGWGRDKDWIPPGPSAPGWHLDGNFFLHFLDSPEQALLVVVLFSDIHPQGGGTFIACDSIPLVARYLAAHPEGVDVHALPYPELIRGCRNFRETTGKAGDVFLLHPFTLHTSSYNHRPEARFMINPVAHFRAPMRFDRRSDASAYAPVEQAVLHALGVDHYDFQPTSPRQKITAEQRQTGERDFLARERERQAQLG